jgi:hypothetical protein
MKSPIIRPALAIALAATIAACGGKASFAVQGMIQGVEFPGLVLSSGGSDLTIAPNQTSFVFPNRIDYGTAYTVSIKSSPAHTSCVIGSGIINNVVTTGASDTAGRLASINVGVFCTKISHSLGGTVTGLTTDGLVLTNGSLGGTATITKDMTTFTVTGGDPKYYAYGQSYGVTVLTQPAGQTCTVSNGVGQMADVDITTVQVSCI